MEKTYKRVPFDIELAKKIQAGEIEGRIVTYFKEYPVRIIAYDILGGYKVAYAQLIGDIEVVNICNENGIGIDNYKALAIELPEETPKHEFKPFDKVLVRDVDKDTWRPRLYSCKGRVGYCMQDNYEYMQILPYEGHEHLVGTTNNPE